uniref:Uncharacterized protein n=1 Tax=Timema cristinae TaxID=61476 RepID=A0A7R9GR64_TIMCR|nr:unnamed protein product [Timema cristinae]
MSMVGAVVNNGNKVTKAEYVLITHNTLTVVSGFPVEISSFRSRRLHWETAVSFSRFLAPSYPSTPPSDIIESEEIWQQLTESEDKAFLYKTCSSLSDDLRCRNSVLFHLEFRGSRRSLQTILSCRLSPGCVKNVREMKRVEQETYTALNMSTEKEGTQFMYTPFSL